MERIVYCLAMALSWLPLWLLYGVSSAVAWLASTFHLYRYRTVRGNIDLAFPEKSEEERRKIIRGFYRHLTDSAVESLKLLSISDKAIRCRVSHVGWEQLEHQVDVQRPVVLYLGHYGNWEVIPSIVWVIPPEFTCAQIYKPMHNALGHTVLERIRNRFGALNIPQKKAFRTLLGFAREGKLSITGFIADQRPNGKFQHWTRFLGLPTAFVTGGEEIGDRIHADYYYIDIEQPRRGHTVLTLKRLEPLPEAPDYPYTRAYWKALEATIRRNPALWLWSHKRWSNQLEHKM